jgi:hypothetical protein
MRALVAIGFVLFAACGDNKKSSTTPDAGGIDAGPEARGACLDRPDQLPRPSTTLPCELMPPGFVPQ